MKRLFQGPAGRLLLLLWSTDIIIMVLFVFYRHTVFFQGDFFNILLERTFGETFQYLKEIWITLICIGLAWRYRSGAYLALGGLFGYLTIDDCFEFHEGIGAVLARKLQFVSEWGVRPESAGELVYLGGAGVLIFGLFGVLYRNSQAAIKAVLRKTLLLLLWLGVFGVGVDFFHELLPPIKALATVTINLEDGGEMIIMSLICAYFFSLTLKSAGPGPKPNPETASDAVNSP